MYVWGSKYESEQESESEQDSHGRRPFACPHGMVWNGLYRTSENDLGGITKFKCCSVGNRVRPSATGLLNAGQNCWGECQSQQGPCAWCGSGSCCRQGWAGNGCDGLIGDPGQHVCSAVGPTPAPTTAGTSTSRRPEWDRAFMGIGVELEWVSGNGL